MAAKSSGNYGRDLRNVRKFKSRTINSHLLSRFKLLVSEINKVY